MSLNLPRIAAALNAYPWTSGYLTSRERMVPTYCAIGAMLRYAGVAQEHIASAQDPDFWERYGPLLQSEYGIPDLQTAMFVMAANDSARSQGEAAERVLGVLTGAIDFDALVREVAGLKLPALDALMREVAGLKPVPAPEPAWKSEPDDDAGSLALVS